MDMNQLTEKAQEAIVSAQREAEQRRNTQLEPEHLLSALLQQDGGVVPAVLDKIGVPPARVKQRLDTILNGFARSASPQPVYASPRFREVFQAARHEAEQLKDDFVSTEHFLLAMVDAAPMRELGITRELSSPQHADYVRINSLLGEVEARVKQQYLTGWLRVLDRLLHRAHRLDDVVAMWDVSRARDAAWTNAETLWVLRDNTQLAAEYLASVDRMVGFAGRGLLIPADTWLLKLTRALRQSI